MMKDDMSKYDYVPPIQMVVKEFKTRMEEHENQVLMKIIYDVGFDVDKDELMKALKYDREQYEKGYADAMKNAVPLNELCEIFSYHHVNVPCNSDCENCIAFDGTGNTVNCWKLIINQWMEEQR